MSSEEKFKFEELKSHLSNPQRRKDLLEIEKKLEVHKFPKQIVIENTSYCNYECIHCSHREMLRPHNTMKKETYNKIVEEIGKKAPFTEIWPTFYGEAFIMGDELWDRLDYTDKVGCKNIVLNSNGSLLRKNNNIDKILKSPLKRFILSLDGFKKETFEKIRAKGKYDEVYPAVVDLCKERKIRKERGEQVPSITAQFSVMKENASEAEDYRAFWNAQGAEVKVRPMQEWGTTGSVRTATIDHSSAFRISCPWANNSMAIHQDGKVVTCPIDYEGLFSVGNVSVGNIEDLSVEEAWKKLGEQSRKFHKNHDWESVPEICKGCGDWQVAGAEYEEQKEDNTRPFWYSENKS